MIHVGLLEDGMISQIVDPDLHLLKWGKKSRSATLKKRCINDAPISFFNLQCFISTLESRLFLCHRFHEYKHLSVQGSLRAKTGAYVLMQRCRCPLSNVMYSNITWELSRGQIAAAAPPLLISIVCFLLFVGVSHWLPHGAKLPAGWSGTSSAPETRQRCWPIRCPLDGDVTCCWAWLQLARTPPMPRWIMGLVGWQRRATWTSDTHGVNVNYLLWLMGWVS